MGPPQQSRGGGRDAKTTALTSPPPELLGALLDALRRQELHTCKTTTACTNYTGRAPSSLHQAAHTHSLTHTRQHLQHAHYTYNTWGGGRGILSMTPWLTTLTTLQMRRPRRCWRGGGTLPLGGRGILRLGPGPCTRHAHSRGRLQASMHPAIHRPAPTAAPTTLAADPRHGHGRGRGGGRPPTQSTTTTNTSQTGATGWRHGQWHCATPHTVATPGTLPTHLPLLHPLPTRQWGCNWGRRHVHSPTTCTLLPRTPPRRCNRDRGHWLGHHTTNVTVTATATVAVATHTSTPTTHSRPTPRHLSRRRQWRRRRRRPTPAVPTQRLCSTILHLWWAATWAPHRAWGRTAPRRCLLPRLDHARYIHLGIHTCWFAGQPRSRQLPQR